MTPRRLLGFNIALRTASTPGRRSVTVPVHVIVAEDEPLVAITVASQLEDGGYRVTVANNGHEAIEADLADAADILVTDLRMPALDGLGLIAHMRERRPCLPIVVMTGYSERLPREEPGRLVIVRKPFWGDRITTAVSALLPCR